MPPGAADGAGCRNAPQTSMPLVLTGIIAGKDPKNGLAILGQTRTAAKVYAVGDNVPGGAKLHSVYSDRVVLDRDGQLESLVLPRQIDAVAPAPTAAASAVPAEQSGSRADAAHDQRATRPARPTSCGPQPVLTHGKMHGFRVYPGPQPPGVHAPGTAPGDLVTAINGTPLDDPASRQRDLQHHWVSSSEARVTVMRNGQQQDLTLNMPQVAQEAEQPGDGKRAGGAAGAAPPVDQAAAAAIRRRSLRARTTAASNSGCRSLRSRGNESRDDRLASVGSARGRAARCRRACVRAARAGAACRQRRRSRQPAQRITPNFKDADITQIAEAVARPPARTSSSIRACAPRSRCSRRRRCRRTRSTRRSCRSCRCTASSPCPRATSSRSCRTPTRASIPADRPAGPCQRQLR